jgi:hypothetical protein
MFTLADCKSMVNGHGRTVHLSITRIGNNVSVEIQFNLILITQNSASQKAFKQLSSAFSGGFAWVVKYSEKG